MFIPARAYEVLVTGRLLGNATGPELADQVSAAAPGELTPGTDWRGATSRPSGADPAEVTIVAVAVAEDRVTPPHGHADYWGDPVTPQFLHDYIAGAEDHWLGRGDRFAPRWVLVH